MNGSSAASGLTDSFAMLLRGEDISWQALGATPSEAFDACAREELTSLVYQRVRSLPTPGVWPEELRDRLARAARTEAATELLRRSETVRVLHVLAGSQIHPILLKGTALAYSVYKSPSLRPRNDTDLLIRRDEVDEVRQIMEQLGYAAPPYCAGEMLFCQFEYARPDDYGVYHAFDFHWKISTQPLFADALRYDELQEVAVAVPALGPDARAPHPVHALLLACIHPAMHHRNVEQLIWVYDVHLLSSTLSGEQFEHFVELALSRKVSAICAYHLALARTRFQTSLPDRVISALAASPSLEPSAEYLREGRRWHHEVFTNLQELTGWRRIRLLREILLPDARYMLDSYGIRNGTLGMVALPALYLHRVLSGAVKIIAGRK